MRYEALICDYDGTIAHEGRVAPATIQAFERLRASGRRLVLVTGRELEGLERAFDRLDLLAAVVAENGGVLYSPDSGEVRLLAAPADARFVEALRERKVEPLSVGRAIVATQVPHDTTVLEAISALGLELEITYNKGAVMVLPTGVTKGSGLQAALETLGLTGHDVIGVGDAENDQAFLSQCALSAAVADALPALKERVDIVLNRPDGDGVAQLIDRLIDDDLYPIKPAAKGRDAAAG